MLVFDGYKLKGNSGSSYEKGGINIVYTGEGQSADAFIESLVQKLISSYNISVVSSDGLIQLAALRKGTKRMSAPELEHDIMEYRKKIDEIISKHSDFRNKLGDTARIIQ